MGEPTSTGIEVHGVDTIPESERTAGPRDVVSILVGTNLCLGLVIFGWLPATFGLSFWACLTAQVAGTFLAIALVAPMALISMRTGTNLSTSSGASFGVRGRLVGSVIGLLLSLGYASLTIWTGGAAVVEPLAELFGLPNSSVSYVLVYALLAAGAVFVAVFGYRVLTRLGSWLAVAMSVLMVAGMLALAGRFDPTPVVDGGYLLGDFWTTWFLAFVATGISGPIAFITLLGDYTRYISPLRHSSRAVLAATAAGLALGLLLPQLFGMFTTFAARAGDDYVGALVAATPLWFLPLLLLNGVFGTVGNAGVLLYSMGLDLDAIVPRLSRVRATVLVSVLSMALVVTGYFVWDAADAVTAFLLLMTAAGTPWAVITVIGFLRCRGRYDPDALQVYNRRSRGGIYWYTGGWSVTATVAWAVGTTLGLLSVDTTIWHGPILELTGGVDVSPLLAGAAAAVTYLLLSRLSEQPMPETSPSPSLVRST
ncbi:purine-cytosine permease family protein [Nocardioides humi]|uniref:Cytosine permease n=1 Tax=Nocardioides humi TaxID=449461 RepID=A0ABN2BKN6_9ACTN|nr:cytosine permease [Nocardioides humi]